MARASHGRALLMQGELATAENDLQSAWAILRSRKQSQIGSGPVVAVARCFELEAELHARQRRFPEAVTSLKQAIEQRRKCVDRSMELSPHPAASLARDLECLAEFLRDNGDSVAAGEALKEAAEIWEKIHLPERVRSKSPDSSA